MEPFHIDVPDEVLNDPQTRLKLTRWVDDFANEGWRYGTNTAYLKELLAYWRAQRCFMRSTLGFPAAIGLDNAEAVSLLPIDFTSRQNARPFVAVGGA